MRLWLRLPKGFRLSDFPALKGGSQWLKSALAAACLVLAGGDSLGQTRTGGPALNWAMGRADAPVTLLEYGSLTCGHCAEFSTDILPDIKRRFIDTGQVRYILRPFPTQPNVLSLALHALTICAGPNRYYPLVDAFFERQAEIFKAADGETGPKGIIFAIAEDFGGLTYTQSETCLRDPASQTQVIASADAGISAGVVGTPTFFVNGVLVKPQPNQGVTEAQLAAAINAALRSRPSPAKAKATPKAKQR
jgi:protein-disulfide isomerase